MNVVSRLLSRVRATSLDVGGWLGDWRLSVALMVLAALYTSFLAIWARSSPAEVVRNIASLSPFWLVYALLLVNTGTCLWRRFGLLRRQVSAGQSLTGNAPTWKKGTRSGIGLNEVRSALARRGYGIETDGSTLWGVANRWTALGTYLFHGAFFLVAAGFLLTMLTRHEANVWVAVGERFAADPSQFRSQSPPRPLSAGLAPVDFEVVRITPEFWRDELLFTRLDADLRLGDGAVVTTRINEPWRSGLATFVRLTGFGYALRYELADELDHVFDSAFVKLNVFPPGQRDFFRIPNYPHRFSVEVLPDFAVVDGEAVTRSLNLVSPAVVVEASRGRIDIGKAAILPDRAFGFDGLRLTFPEIRYWGEFAIVHDPGAPVLFAGYVFGIVGLLLKLGGPRREVRWQPGDGGGTLTGWRGAPPDGPEFCE